MPQTSGSMMVRHDVLMPVAAAMRADAADLDAVIDRLSRAVGATSSLTRSPPSRRQDGARAMSRPTRPRR